MKTSLTQCAAATLAVVAALSLSACDKREGAAGPGAGTGSSSSSGGTGSSSGGTGSMGGPSGSTGSTGTPTR